MVDTLKAAGFKNIIATDILTGHDIFTWRPEQHIDIVVTNPPFSKKYKIIKRLYSLGIRWAMVMPGDTLMARSAQRLFEQYGMELILLDKRIDYKMPIGGYKGTAQFSSAWFTHGLNIGKQITYAKLDKPKKSKITLVDAIRSVETVAAECDKPKFIQTSFLMEDSRES